MTAGCLVGMLLLKLIDSKRLLQISGVLTIVLLLSALFGSKGIALIAFPAVGFSISMMYSIVFSLALNSASQHHGSFAGILCSAIVGGAGGPMIGQHDSRCYVAENRYVVYPGLCRIHHVHRLLGSPVD